MIVADVNTKNFQRGLHGLIFKAGLSPRKVIPKEMGELLKTLVKVTPPADPARTRERIKQDIEGRFQTIGDESNSLTIRSGGSMGSTGIHWYAVDEKFLRGVAPQNDMRGASVSELNALRFRVRSKGRTVWPFKHPHRRQQVLLRQTILTKRSTVSRLVTRIRKHVGRLKAGWLVAVAEGALLLTGGNQPPKYVRENMFGARGRFSDNTRDKNNPRFAVTNFAKGIGKPAVNWLVKKAMAIRAKAMRENARLFLSGKKKLIDYA